MRKFGLTRVSAFAVFLTLTMFLNSTARAADSVKIGGISLQRIVDHSKAGIKALSKVKKKAEREGAIVRKKQEAIQKLEKEIEQKGMMMVDSALEKKRLELGRLRREFELYKGDVQAALQQAQNKEIRELMANIMKVIKKYAKKNGYNLVIEKEASMNLASGMVIYMDDSMDLTDTIIKLLDKQFDKSKGAG